MSKERKEKLAISLVDLDRLSPQLRAKVARILDLTQVIEVGFDRVTRVPAVVFTCDLLTAAIVCDGIRSDDRKHHRQPTNLYVNRDRSWGRITNEIVLTVELASGIQLNPTFFPDVQLEAQPPAVKKIFG